MSVPSTPKEVRSYGQASAGSQTPSKDHSEKIQAASEIRTERPRSSQLAFSISQMAGSAGLALWLSISFMAWLIVGAIYHFPHWWELVMTVGIPGISLVLLTFLQHTQIHADRVTQLKLGELIRASENATNRMITLEDASSTDLDRISSELTLPVSDQNK
jgi:low affinity Fe/Cu permease